MSTETTQSSKINSGALLRTMGLFSLVVYGVGDMVGSGIYATVGKAAGAMGNAVWLAFVVSMVAALFTGLSYACIASRYPRAAGAAYVTQHAFGLPFLSYMIGLTVTASGLTSMATQTNAFTDTLQHLINAPWLLIALLFLAAMTFVNFWGIRESMWTNLLCTAVEVGGLLFIIAVGARYWGSVNYLQSTKATVDAAGVVTDHGLSLPLVLGGAVLTFFSFVGFEDMLNVSEEVKEPHRTMPWGIILALAIVTVLYIGISVTAVSVVDYREFTKPNSPAPLAMIANRAAPWLPSHTFSFITMFAVANSMLINYIMGSRLLYGMARHGLLPAALGRVHATRRTPHVAIMVLLGLIIVLTLVGNISELASATSLLLLFSFAVVNSALVVLKMRPNEAKGSFEVPVVVPVIGVIINATLIIGRVFFDPTVSPRAPYIAGAILLAVAAMFFIVRPREITEDSLAALAEES